MSDADVAPIAIAPLTALAILIIVIRLSAGESYGLHCLPPYRHGRHRDG